MLILEQTPFYAESGGQVGDTGVIFSDKFRINVINTQNTSGESVHIGELSVGDIPDGFMGPVTAEIDSERRADIQRNHTATHLLHRALRLVLGDHVHQSGSLVAPERLRFDFSHFKALTAQEIEEVEKLVNDKIGDDLAVTWEIKSFNEAKKIGAMALFGEKYGDTVRVVRSGDFSMELCGGTHVSHTGDIGQFFITSESAIAAGVRRIEAITGREAANFLSAQKELIANLNGFLEMPPEKLDDKAVAEIKSLKSSIHPRLLIREQLAIKLAELLDTIARLEKEKVKSDIRAIQSRAGNIEPALKLQMPSGALLVYIVNSQTASEFMTYFDTLKASNSGNIIAVISGITGQLAIHSSDYAFASKIKDDLFQLVGAKGGGKPTIRGSMPVDKIDQAIAGLKDKYVK